VGSSSFLSPPLLLRGKPSLHARSAIKNPATEPRDWRAFPLQAPAHRRQRRYVEFDRKLVGIQEIAEHTRTRLFGAGRVLIRVGRFLPMTAPLSHISFFIIRWHTTFFS
jgi:hypothetical protein